MKIELRCNKCNALQKKDEKQSDANWQMYKSNAKCKCGGKFKFKIIK